MHRLNPTVAVLPVGAFEQHGSHLPLSTDTLIASTIARRVADRYGLLLLPPVSISCSHEHEAFDGTVSISSTTLAAVIADVAASLARQGIQRLVLVNAHGGNYVLSNIVQESNVGQRSMALFPRRQDWEQAREAAQMETNSREDMHGGELETSIMLEVFPTLVAEDYAQADHEATERPDLLVTGMQEYATTGVIGKPSAATAPKGKAALDSLTDSFASCLESLEG